MRLHVKPRASRSRVVGVRGGALEVAVTAPPVDGQANAEVVRVVAKYFGVKRRAVEIVSGEGARTKLVSVAGLTAHDVRAKAEEHRA